MHMPRSFLCCKQRMMEVQCGNSCQTSSRTSRHLSENLGCKCAIYGANSCELMNTQRVNRFLSSLKYVIDCFLRSQRNKLSMNVKFTFCKIATRWPPKTKLEEGFYRLRKNPKNWCSNNSLPRWYCDFTLRRGFFWSPKPRACWRKFSQKCLHCTKWKSVQNKIINAMEKWLQVKTCFRQLTRLDRGPSE